MCSFEFKNIKKIKQKTNTAGEHCRAVSTYTYFQLLNIYIKRRTKARTKI